MCVLYTNWSGCQFLRWGRGFQKCNCFWPPTHGSRDLAHAQWPRMHFQCWSMGTVITRNSWMNSLRFFKFGGRVGHVRQLFKVKRSRSHGHAEEIYAVKGSRDIRPVYDHLGGSWPLTFTPRDVSHPSRRRFYPSDCGGHYCIYFCMLRNSGITMREIVVTIRLLMTLLCMRS